MSQTDRNTPTLPGYWQFAWMFFMQPVTLHHRLKACGVDQPVISGWAYWRQRRDLPPVYGQYLCRLLSLLGIPLLGVGLLAMLAFGWGWGLPWLRIMEGVAVGVALGVAFGVAGGVAFGVAGGVAGVAVGVAVGVAEGVAGVARGVAGGVVLSLILSLVIGVADGVKSGVTGGVATGLAAGLAFSVTFLHLWRYPVEALLQLLLRRPSSLRFSPVLFLDLSYLPYPGLTGQLLRAAPSEPALVKRVLAACAIAPGQRKLGQRVLAQLQAEEAQTLLQQQRFAELAELRGQWLPGVDTNSRLLAALRALARTLEAAQHSSAAYLIAQHMQSAEAQLRAMDNQLASADEPLAAYFPAVLRVAGEVLATMREANAAAAAATLPNPFIAGNPLSGAQRWGQQLFRGRERHIRQVERLLADAHSANSFALLGPRRCGKSTLLNMLRRQLPDTQLVLFDLQGNPADSPLAFYRGLVRQAQRQAEEDRRLKLPDLPEGAPIEALAAWLDLLERDQRVTRFLICIDEFERLPDLFPVSADGPVHRDLLQFLGLLRATAQHRQHVRLLVAGAAPFDELETLWTDHLINLQEIQVGFLDAASAEGLLTQPCPEMPADAIPVALARAMVARTAGQPYLTQLYGQILIDQLNDAERRQASLDDLEPVEREALSKAVNYFQNIWRALRPDAAQALLTLAQGQPLALPSTTRRYLQRRLLIGEDDRLSIPLFQRWLLENQLEAEGGSGRAD